MRMPKVYIVLVNYGTPDDTIECLDSILQNSHREFQVVIVDIQNINHSIKRITNWISEKRNSRFELVAAPDNNGFAFANNIGIRHLLSKNDADFIWILNNDTVIEKESISKQLDFYDENSVKNKIGFIGAKTMDYYNRRIIQNVGGIFNKRTKFPDWIGAGKEDHGQYDSIKIVDHVQGASMFFHISLLDSIGYMDETYFLYFEDTDWSIKALKSGFYNMVCTEGIIFHKQGKSTGVNYLNDKDQLGKKKYFYFNLLKLYKLYFKHYLPYAYYFLFKKFGGRVYHKEWEEAKLLWQVFWMGNKQRINVHSQK
jgi:GT2 family glycosyltransferase